jgi:hypothetical protein
VANVATATKVISEVRFVSIAASINSAKERRLPCRHNTTSLFARCDGQHKNSLYKTKERGGLGAARRRVRRNRDRGEIDMGRNQLPSDTPPT